MKWQMILLISGIVITSSYLIIGSQYHENTIPPSNFAIGISVIPLIGLTLGFVGILSMFNGESVAGKIQGDNVTLGGSQPPQTHLNKFTERESSQ